MAERAGIWRERGMSDFSQEIEPAATLTAHAGFARKIPDSRLRHMLAPDSSVAEGTGGSRGAQ